MELAGNRAAFLAAVDFAAVTRARVTFIALGAPLQEQLAAAIAARAETPGMGATGLGLCIGAASGFRRRNRHAARRLWMQRAGLEWLHRLARDPRRLDPPLSMGTIRRSWRRCLPRPGGPACPSGTS